MYNLFLVIYLIHPDNYRDLYKAIVNAFSVGCDVFHARPGGDTWFDLKGKKFEFDSIMIEYANKLIEEGRVEFENSKFKVFGVVHKFTDTWGMKHSFKKCYATATNCFISPSGIIGLCCDRRGDTSLDLCSVEEQLENLKIGWGSDKHKQIINEINLSKCPRCTYTHINELFENVIIEDKMGCDFI